MADTSKRIKIGRARLVITVMRAQRIGSYFSSVRAKGDAVNGKYTSLY